MAPIRFVLNGSERSVDGFAPTTTVLQYLRGTERLVGTKEGCAEGDCGACTVILEEPDAVGSLRRRAVNACITFLPALHGRGVETVEHLSAGGDLAPIQREMVDRHASQCGFCTPGFAVQLHAAWRAGSLTDRQSVKDEIAGNLCRCTGYGPIIEAGVAVAALPRPETRAPDATMAARLTDLRGSGTFRYEAGGGLWFSPGDVDALADLYAEHPQATLVAGATDVGLWVTKGHREFEVMIDVSRVADLAHVEEAPGRLFLGAAVTHAQATRHLATLHPDLGEVMRRFAGPQVRNAGTVGGNIANGSPIGDLPPVLIALGATLYLRRGDEARSLALEDFFIEYGRQDRAPGEFVAAVEVPVIEPNERFAAYKISKRTESDISAVLAAFKLRFEGRTVVAARLAFGGMAGTPKRALNAEAALVGRPFDAEAAARAAAALEDDFQPLDDLRASADYRLKTAANLVERFRLELLGGVPTRIAEVA